MKSGTAKRSDTRRGWTMSKTQGCFLIFSLMGDLFLLMDNNRTNGFLQLDQIEVVPAGL